MSDKKRKGSKSGDVEIEAKKAYSGAGTAEFVDGPESASIVFSLPEKVGVLADALQIFKDRKVNMKHIESRPSRDSRSNYDFFVDLEDNVDKGHLDALMKDLKSQAKTVTLHHQEAVPWFPRKISDLDKFADRVLTYGSELDADHPGFTDEVYRARRKQFADIAISYRHGEPLPNVEYTKAEIGTWNTVFTELTKLYPTHACKELNYIFPLLVQNCDFK
jgi:phenylalanine-4-hydroxylase